MIVTITLNPSVDISYHLSDALLLDDVNRINNISKTAGGKGLNVTRVLKQLNMDVAATGFLGGSLGQFIREELHNLAVQDEFVAVSGATRNCIAILHEGHQTEILEGGPEISPQEAALFLHKIEPVISSAKYVTISGSLPQGLPANYYNEILDIANKQDTPVLLDTKGELLQLALKHKHKPFLIKPNQSELQEVTGQAVPNKYAVSTLLKSDLFIEVPWVIVTLGKDGAIVKQGSELYHVGIPKIEAVNPVGSGDAVLAGFAAGLAKGFTDGRLMKYGIAMGVLNAMQAKTGEINPNKIDFCMEQITLQEIN